MQPSHIIIHHSLTDDGRTVSWDAIRWYHVKTNGWTDIGYQAGIELIGSRYEILMGRMLTEAGAHTVGMNEKSIGICMVGNFDLAPPPAAQFDLLVRFTRSLMEIFGIPIENVKRHADYAPKSCPGTQFPWEQFLGRLQ